MKLNQIIDAIKSYDGRPIKIMEVCGTHTSAIIKNGIPSLLPPSIKLVSGPGCPVCVTSAGYIDKLIELSGLENYCVLSFGDMLRVPGLSESLMTTPGANYKMIYSPNEAIKYASEHPEITYIVAAVGFETTAASYAALMDEIVAAGVKNIKLLTSIKTMPAALKYICDIEPDIDAFICPGHVSVIIGARPYEALADKFKRPFVISGFTADHIICTIYEILSQIKTNSPKMVNLYPSSVSYEGNEEAQRLLDKYFEPSNVLWRGIGEIEGSGLVLRREYKGFDAGRTTPSPSAPPLRGRGMSGCKCSEVLLGRILPSDCALFGKTCTPMTPIGACMVSREGACGIYYENQFAAR